jgi:hypothetical protein
MTANRKANKILLLANIFKHTTNRTTAMISEEIKRIEERLKDLGLTKTEFAIALGAPEDNASSYYNNWRNRGLPKSRLSAAADFLSATVEWVTSGNRELKTSRENCSSQSAAIDSTRKLTANQFISACVTCTDRNYFIAALHEDDVEVHLVIVVVPGGIKSTTIRQMIDDELISRLIQLDEKDYARFNAGAIDLNDLFDGQNYGFWDRIQIITHDSIYTPEVRDRSGSYIELPNQLGVILELFKTQQIDLDDLIIMEQMALRLASKTPTSMIRERQQQDLNRAQDKTIHKK